VLISNILATINSEMFLLVQQEPDYAIFVRSGFCNLKEVYGKERYRILKIIPEKKRILWLKSFVDNGGRV